jgi:hypothetical protein
MVIRQSSGRFWFVMDFCMEMETIVHEDDIGLMPAMRDCMKTVREPLTLAIASSVPLFPTSLVTIIVSYVIPVPLGRDKSNHSRDLDEYINDYHVMYDFCTPGNPEEEEGEEEEEEGGEEEEAEEQSQ